MKNNLSYIYARTDLIQIFILALFLSPTLSAQNTTSYSIKSHAITLESERALIVVDPSITFLYVAGSDFNGFDNIRGAKFKATIDGNFSAGGELLERQSTLSPFLTDFSRKSDRLPGWGRFKTLSSLTETDIPLKVDVARATGFIEWSEKGNKSEAKGFNARLANEAINFGWAHSPILLNRDDIPYPSVKVGWGNTNLDFDLRAFQWVGNVRGPLGSTTEPLFNRIHGALASGKYNSESWGVAMLFGSAKEVSQDTSNIDNISAISISGFTLFDNIRLLWEVSKSSTAEEGFSWQLGGEYTQDNIKIGVNHYVTQADLYGGNGGTEWSNAGIPLGIMTGGNSKSSVIYAEYRNILLPKWIILSEVGALKSTQYDYDLKWVKANISRVIIEDWDLCGRVSFEYIIPADNFSEGPSGWIINMGIIHGIINP
jgi:hypothetical protein